MRLTLYFQRTFCLSLRKLINKFQKRCVKISFKENIEIEPHIIIYNVSPDGLETEPFVK